MKKIVTMMLLILAGVALSADDSPLVFKNEGFSIRPLEADQIGDGHTILMMFLPVEGGFPPSVNVITQDYTESLEAYKGLSDRQFTELGLYVLVSQVEGDSYTMEYTGVLQGQDLHSYGKAIKRGTLIYLVTGTTTPDQWEKYKEKIKEVVESFRLTE